MIFWKAGALGSSGNSSKTGNGDVFMILWGIPFVFCGQYLVWGAEGLVVAHPHVPVARDSQRLTPFGLVSLFGSA
jgi:hypothetical protein